MATSYTSLLGLALPVTGELQGTWGDIVNEEITSLLDSAIAGTTTISTDGDVTLTDNEGESNQARASILLFTGARTAARTVTAPAKSKIYSVINDTTGGYSVTLVGAGPTTGVTIIAGETAVVAWDGSDFVKIGNVGGSSTFSNLTVTGTTTLSGLTASTALALDSSKNVVSVTNTGTGNNVLSASPTLTGTANGASLQLSSLTSGRVTYAGASGLLQDSANMTFNGTTLSAAGFSGPIGASSASTGAFTSLTASADSAFTSTGALAISKGTTAQQPGSPTTGMMRYNTSTNQFEGYSGSSPAWKSIGGSALSNDTSTSSNLYPVFSSATSGTAENLYTSNANYLFKPSTGELQALELVASNGIVVNSATVSADYTIATGNNAMSAGPVAVDGGITVTVSSGSVWTVI